MDTINQSAAQEFAKGMQDYDAALNVLFFLRENKFFVNQKSDEYLAGLYAFGSADPFVKDMFESVKNRLALYAEFKSLYPRMKKKEIRGLASLVEQTDEKMTDKTMGFLIDNTLAVFIDGKWQATDFGKFVFAEILRNDPHRYTFDDE